MLRKRSPAVDVREVHPKLKAERRGIAEPKRSRILNIAKFPMCGEKEKGSGLVVLLFTFIFFK